MERLIAGGPPVPRRVLAFLLVVAVLVSLQGCGSTPGEAQNPTATAPSGRLSVVATTTQIRSMTEAVAGDLASVRSILTPGSDPHEYEPRPSDVAAISTAALVLKNGIGLDDWMDKIIRNAGGSGPLVTVSKGVPVRKGDAQDPNGDPHIWLNATNAVTMTINIRDALAEVDGAHADTYRANAEAYMARLSELDKYIMDRTATIPSGQRKMVTNHDGFGYYIDRYGLTFVGSIIPSMSTEAQPSAQDVADLAAKIKAQNVTAIFLENSVNPQLARQIGRDAGVKVVDTLYADTLGEPGTPGATYEGMMRYDTDTIVSALK